jgi:hypothetical protein
MSSRPIHRAKSAAVRFMFVCIFGFCVVLIVADAIFAHGLYAAALLGC